MDDFTGGIVSGQKSISRELAELAYYEKPRFDEEKPADMIPFENLPDEERNKYLDQSRNFLIYLNKMELTVIPISHMQQRVDAGKKSLEALTQTIEGFVKKLNTTKPALFPSKELAIRIFDVKI